MDRTAEYKSWNGIDSDEDIVISGIADRFPNSDNMNHLREREREREKERIFSIKLILLKQIMAEWKIND